MRLTFTIVAVLAAAALAGCGGAEPATSEAETDNAQDTARTQLERCLREQGLDPGERGRLDDADRDRFREALEGPCREFREQAFGSRDRSDPEFQDAVARMEACLREQGIEGEIGGDTMLELDDPETREAFEKCRGELPERP
jgi:hypothetical protein